VQDTVLDGGNAAVVRELYQIRRVVTGHDEEGRSVVLFDGPPPQIGRPAQLWAAAGAPADNTGTEDTALLPMRLDAPPQGSRFWLVRMEPGNGVDRLANQRKASSLRSQGAQTIAGARPDMHRTDTLDYMVVLEGAVTLILDEGEVDLRQFDCVVQRGTAHCWENRSSEPALLMFVLLDAQPVVAVAEAPLREGDSRTDDRGVSSGE
jgi:mannose-6-phosphate isomerase-like protein (cupin superfamily)